MESCESSIYSKLYTLFIKFAWALQFIALTACSSIGTNNTVQVGDKVILADTGADKKDGRSTLTDPWGPSVFTISNSGTNNICDAVPGEVTLKDYGKATTAAGGFLLVKVAGKDASNSTKECIGWTLRTHIRKPK